MAPMQVTLAESVNRGVWEQDYNAMPHHPYVGIVKGNGGGIVH